MPWAGECGFGEVAGQEADISAQGRRWAGHAPGLAFTSGLRAKTNAQRNKLPLETLAQGVATPFAGPGRLLVALPIRLTVCQSPRVPLRPGVTTEPEGCPIPGTALLGHSFHGEAASAVASACGRLGGFLGVELGPPAL